MNRRARSSAASYEQAGRQQASQEQAGRSQATSSPAIRRLLALGGLVAALLPGSAATGSVSTAQPGSRLPAYQHLFVLVLENHSLASVLGNPNLPTLNALIRQGALATNAHGVTHPSLPNYVALVSGGTWGSHSDNPAQRFSADNLGSQLTRSGRTWRTYAQGLPHAGDLSSVAGSPPTYAKKHNPLLLFSAIADDPAQARSSVPLAALATDLAAHTLPAFALIVPDLCHDLHGGAGCPRGAALDQAGDAFVRQWAGRLMSAPEWRRSALIITFDEGVGEAGLNGQPGGGRILTLALGGQVRPGRFAAPLNHYSLLRAVEENFGLPLLGEAKTATSLGPLLGRP